MIGTINESCPLCGHTSVQKAMLGQQDAVEISCQCCGTYKMTGMLLETLDVSRIEEADIVLFPYLSAYTRQTYEKGSVSELDIDNWRDYARAHQATRVTQKVTKLLEYIANRTTCPGASVRVDSLDYPLFDASSNEEVYYLLEHLMGLGYLRAETSEGYILTVPGWERLEPPIGGVGIPGRCFVAMSFDPSLNDAYHRGIRAAIEDDCKLRAVRIDLVDHNEKICDKILAEIQRAQFMVADFTYHRGGVYFEAGFAMGLRRPVIWTCREDEADKTHFDTRQYNQVRWTTPEDLRAKLTDRIRGTILK